MSIFDVIYPAFAIVTLRFWWPPLASFLREIREIGDPEHRSPISTHELGRPRRFGRGSDTAGYGPPVAENPAHDFQRRSRPRPDLASRRRWEGGFGRRVV